MEFYEIKQVNFKESIYRQRYLGDNYYAALKKFIEEATWKTNDNDILLLITYGRTDYPSPYAIFHYENNQFFRHIWKDKKTLIVEFYPIV